ncbi:MAG: hypothetical protein QF382_03985, partial [Acidimicrobiales bacterium]|nr:hypothetical protein [Acidimicrobiales bacterium]
LRSRVVMVPVGRFAPPAAATDASSEADDDDDVRISAASDAVGAPIAYEIVDRRPGDIEQIYADPAYAKDVLGWEATRDLATMMRDHWNWQRSNPDGFRD